MRRTWSFAVGVLGMLCLVAALKRTHFNRAATKLHRLQLSTKIADGRPATTIDLRKALVLRDTPVESAQAPKSSPSPATNGSPQLSTDDTTADRRECCQIEPLPPLNVSLTSPKAMGRPVRVVMQTGHVDGAWLCDVPCEFSTSIPADGDVDVIVGEAGAPTVPAKVRRVNPSVLTAARSMESSVNYPQLRQLWTQVGAAMTTSLSTSTVPVVYMSRSSVRKWRTPAVWNGGLAQH